MEQDIDIDDTETSASAKEWWSRIEAAKEAFRPAWEVTRQAWEEYLGPQLKAMGQGVADTNSLNNHARYPIYWSSTKSIQPMLYSRTPIPIAEKAFDDLEDDIARLACQDLERLAHYLIRSCAFDSTMAYMRDTYIHGGKATCRVYFESEINEAAEKVYYTPQQVPVPQQPQQPQQPGQPPMPQQPPQMQTIYINNRGEQADPAQLQQDETGIYIEMPGLDSACVYICPVHYRDVLHNPNARWVDEITWQAYRSTFTREEFRKKFGRVEGITFNVPKDSDRVSGDDKLAKIPTATVWEIWDRDGSKVLWLAEGKRDEFIKPLVSETEEYNGDDPYDLDDFFPAVNFLLGTCGPDSLNPIPDYVQLRPAILQLHGLAERLQTHVLALKTLGVYDSGVPGLKEAIDNLGSGMFGGLENFTELVGDKGLEGLFRFFPMGEISSVIQQIMTVTQMYEEKFNQLWGIPDIVRGGNAPNEGYQKQQMKGEWMSLRATVPGRQFQRAVRDAIEKMCDLALKMFPEEKLIEILGVRYNKPEDQALWPQRLLLLRDDDERKIRINIQTDSTVLMNENMELEQRNYLAKTVTDGFAAIAAATQQDADFAPAAIEALIQVVAGTQKGKSLEGLLRILQKKKQEQLAQPQQPQQDPKLQIEQMKQQGKMQELQVKSQLDQQKMQGEFQLSQAKAQTDAQIEQIQAQADIQTTMAKIQAEIKQAQIEGAAKIEIETQLAQLQGQLKILEAGLKAKQAEHDMAVSAHDAALDTHSAVLKTALDVSKPTAQSNYETRQQILLRNRLANQAYTREVPE